MKHQSQLLHDIAEAEVPTGSLDLTERVRQQAHTLLDAQQPARRAARRPLRLAMAALCLAALVGGGLQFLPGQAPRVSAQEALRRAEQTTAFGLSGIRSLHGVMETHAPGSGTIVREEIWVDLPTSRLRRAIVWPATAQSEAEVQTDLTNGVAAWRWSTPASQPDVILYDGVSQIDPGEVEVGLLIVPNPTQSLDTAGDPTANLCTQPGDQLSTLGEETVQGRATLVIECRLGAASGQAGTRLKLWIDKQLFVVLKHEHYDSTGALFVESRFSQFEVDQELPNADQIFMPPGA